MVGDGMERVKFVQIVEDLINQGKIFVFYFSE